MKSKKLLRVKARKNSQPNGYFHINMNFALVSDPADDRTQCTDLVTCRESVNIGPYLCKAEKTHHSLHLYAKDAPVDFQKLRLLIVKDVDKEQYGEFKTALFSGKALLNRYEEKAGWCPSKIVTVKHPYYDNAWLLTGPKEWMSQPQLLAVVTLFIRLMSKHGPLNVNNTFQQAEDSLRTLYTNYKEKQKEYYGENKKDVFTIHPDIEDYLQYLDKIKCLIVNAKKIFDGVGLEDAWTLSENGSSFGVNSGILSFFGDNKLNYNKKISISQNRFKDLAKQFNLK